MHVYEPRLYLISDYQIFVVNFEFKFYTQMMYVSRRNERDLT